ncbi:hypothetical protein Aduo_016695 [Ancylostoma duodenale]
MFPSEAAHIGSQTQNPHLRRSFRVAGVQTTTRDLRNTPVPVRARMLLECGVREYEKLGNFPQDHLSQRRPQAYDGSNRRFVTARSRAQMNHFIVIPYQMIIGFVMVTMKCGGTPLCDENDELERRNTERGILHCISGFVSLIFSIVALHFFKNTDIDIV